VTATAERGEGVEEEEEGMRLATEALQVAV
jgi:hypothetical protein